jgi:hypothetical protein
MHVEQFAADVAPVRDRSALRAQQATQAATHVVAHEHRISHLERTGRFSARRSIGIITGISLLLWLTISIVIAQFV